MKVNKDFENENETFVIKGGIFNSYFRFVQ